ncbi:hypothetical protein [Herbidospora sp. RD11066]
MDLLRTGLALVLASAIGTTGCAQICPRTGSVGSVPSAADPPERTVAVYLAAINARDGDTMDELSTPAYAEHGEAVRCDWTVSHAKITGVGPDRDLQGRFWEVVQVGVLFELSQRDETPEMPSGETGLSYWLGRNGPADRWLIYDSGHG